MKHTFLIYLTGIVYCLASCTQASRSYPHSMQRAMECISHQPDSALVWLQGMIDSLDNLPEEARMYHHLLTLQAEDSQYMIHTDDSLVTRIVDFYQTSDEPAKLVSAYYLTGKVYVDMNDAPQALKAFRQALEIPEVSLDMKERIYDEMSSLFSAQGLNDNAIEVKQKLADIHRKKGNLQGMMTVQRDLARLYEQKELSDSAILCYGEACRTAWEMKDSGAYYAMKAECAGLQYEADNDPEAIRVLIQAERREDIMDKSYIHFMLAKIYKDRCMWDSVAHYSRKVVESGNIEKAYYSYRELYELEKRKGNHVKALEYMERAMNSRNLLQTISQREATAQINALYNYQHISSENAELKLNKERQKNVILILVLLLAMITFACFAFISYQRKRSRQALEREKKLKQLAEERYAQSREAIGDNERKIVQLTEQLAEARKANDLLVYGSLEMELKQLQLQNEAILLSRKEMQKRISLFEKSALCQLIHQASQNDAIVLTEEDWEQLWEAINYMYPTLNKHLSDVFPGMPVQARQLCWLSKMGISPAGIARILKRSRQAITNTRSKLNKVIANSSLPDRNFDEFIANLF